MTGRDLYASRTEAAVSTLLDQWADEIVAGLTSLTHTFNPQALILGGGLMSQPEIISLVQNKFADRVLPSFSKAKILAAQLGNQAGIYGAYVLAASADKHQNF